MQPKKYAAFVPGLGEHQVYNALAALAAATEIGVGIIDTLERLKSFRNVERHLEVIEMKNGAIIIDDSWNSNPTSIGAALKVFKEISGLRKKIIVLGDAQEIGDLGKDAFRQLGSQIAKMGIDVLITIGPLTQELALQSIKEGMTG